MITLTLTPHLERGGYHLDRFQARLDGELICDLEAAAVVK
jgi:hypothetical protein